MVLRFALVIASAAIFVIHGEELKDDKNFLQNRRIYQGGQIISPRTLDQLILEPQTQYPSGGFLPGIQPQPQILIYANPGQQHFLYRPGGAPPGNVLIPQPQPGGTGIFFDNPSVQGGIPGYPGAYPGVARTPFVPPIEKDAEEIPAEIARNHPTASPFGQQFGGVQKSQRLETFDEESDPTASEIDDLEKPAKNPKPTLTGKKPPLPNSIPALKPGHQFFILNGHDLFSNYPFNQQTPTVQAGRVPALQPGLYQPNPQVYLYHQGAPGAVPPQYTGIAPPPPAGFGGAQHYIDQQSQHQIPHHLPIQDLFQRNSITGQISDVKLDTTGAENYLGAFHQPTAADLRHNYLVRAPLPVALNNPYEFRSALQQIHPVGGLAATVPASAAKSQPAEDEDDTVVIDAKITADEKLPNQAQSDVPSTVKHVEAPLSQAEPAAIALAGIGGVASAAPKGTALSGLRGLAVAAPKATAIAGPKKEDKEKQKDKDDKDDKK